jgi:hypothetical protein
VTNQREVRGREKNSRLRGAAHEHRVKVAYNCGHTDLEELAECWGTCSMQHELAEVGVDEIADPV